jgi:NAD(P)-dependent dehydrogenase (short-subunit alcohol dehydrogenase family)
MERFTGKVAVITGGARGIGKTCASRLASEGGKVAILDINLAEARVTAAEIGPNAMAVFCNIAEHESVHLAIQQVLECWGRVDVLVANAGIYRAGPLTDDQHLEDFQRVLNINLTGTYLCCHAVAPTMIAQQSGSIVMMSSIAAKTSWPASAAYSAAKTGEIGLMRSIAMELGPYNVNCNAVCLGHADTDMLRAVDSRICTENGWEPGTYLKELADTNPMKRLATVEETAALVAFLASDEARYINGQAIELDGGRIMS